MLRKDDKNLPGSNWEDYMALRTYDEQLTPRAGGILRDGQQAVHIINTCIDGHKATYKFVLRCGVLSISLKSMPAMPD
jgi:hypothetical protein